MISPMHGIKKKKLMKGGRKKGREGRKEQRKEEKQTLEIGEIN